MKEIQQALNEMAPNLDRLIGFADGQGQVLAASDEEVVGSQDPGIRAVLASGDSQVTAGDRSYRVSQRPDDSYLISFSEGVDPVSKAYVELLSRWISSEECKRDDHAMREHELKQLFLKNVLLENELPGDIPLKAREFRIRYNARRTVLLVHFKPEEFKACLETLTDLTAEREDDFVLPIDEQNIVLLAEATEESLEGLDDFLSNLTETLKDRAMADVTVGVGMLAPTLTETAKAYQQASIALTVGEIFRDAESPIMRYEKLGLGRLIYQLPITLCELFLREVFEPGTYEALDPVTMNTINKFFENNLNGSETSRQLFVHRNTLVYRLDKVEKITGLDLRNFEDAVLFKLADMVRDYLAHVEEQKAGK
ncbi:MAG: PucR family transcriptional regulator [Clostridiaceae bacterium]|jgi:carbohydrate diacid regulator|nr:PucR family transcriptional regulator [Clostridiaceae bacterium]